MGFKTGLMFGFGAGYVFGAQAGRERYEQLRRTFDQAMRSETARSLQDNLQSAWKTAQEEFPAVATVSDALRDDTTRGDRGRTAAGGPAQSSR